MSKRKVQGQVSTECMMANLLLQRELGVAYRGYAHGVLTRKEFRQNVLALSTGFADRVIQAIEGVKG